MKTEKIKIRENEEYIRLDNFLKLAGAVETGGQAKIMIQDGEVLVNGEVCTMRGKKLRRKDTAQIDEDIFEVC